MKTQLSKKLWTLLALPLLAWTVGVGQAVSAEPKGAAVVLKGYLESMRELAKDNYDKGLAGLKKFEADLKNFSDASLAKEKEAVSQELTKALAAKDLSSLRSAVRTLSEKVLELHEKGGFGKMGVNAFVCPMKGGGKWLSQSSAVENPYYGSMMFDCGEKIKK